MKIIHTSDWHLGKTFFGKKLTEEQSVFFEKTFFPLLEDIKPDLLIITGDIVDKPNPDYETQQLFKDILYTLFDKKIPAIFILGNHDSKRISLYKEFLRNLNLILVDDLRYFKNPFVFENRKGEKAYFYILPYLSLYELKENMENFWQEEIQRFAIFFNSKNQLFLKELVELLLSFQNSLKRPSFLLGHFALEKGIFTGEEITLKCIGREEIFPINFFEKYDFLLLGHLHRLQKISHKAYYAGSLLPYSFEEANYNKGVWFLELKNNSLIKEEKIYLTSSFKIKTLKGYFEDLIKYAKDEAYIKVILKDEVPILHPFERLKTVFPNLLVLEYEEKDKSNANYDFNADSLEIFDKAEIDLNEEKLFKEFYKLIEGNEIDEKLFKVFQKYLENFNEELNKETL